MKAFYCRLMVLLAAICMLAGACAMAEELNATLDKSVVETGEPFTVHVEVPEGHDRVYWWIPWPDGQYGVGLPQQTDDISKSLWYPGRYTLQIDSLNSRKTVTVDGEEAILEWYDTSVDILVTAPKGILSPATVIAPDVQRADQPAVIRVERMDLGPDTPEWRDYTYVELQNLKLGKSYWKSIRHTADEAYDIFACDELLPAGQYRADIVRFAAGYEPSLQSVYFRVAEDEGVSSGCTVESVAGWEVMQTDRVSEEVEAVFYYLIANRDAVLAERCSHEPARSLEAEVRTALNEREHSISSTWRSRCLCGQVNTVEKTDRVEPHQSENKVCRVCGYEGRFGIVSPTGTDELLRADFTLKWQGLAGSDNYTVTMVNLTSGDVVLDHVLALPDASSDEFLEREVLFSKYTASPIGCDGMSITLDALDAYGNVAASDTVKVKLLGYDAHAYGADGICTNCCYHRDGAYFGSSAAAIASYGRNREIPSSRFDADQIRHVYYIRSVRNASHTALMLVDAQRRGLYYSFYNDDNLGVDTLTPAELEQFFQTGAVYDYPLSNGQEYGNRYLTYFDMIDIACLFSGAERKQIALRCVEYFAKIREEGDSYNLLLHNCDDMAHRALYGWDSVNVIPHNTFNNLWERAWPRGATYRRVDQPNMGMESSSLDLFAMQGVYDLALDAMASLAEPGARLRVIDHAVLRTGPGVAYDYVMTVDAGAECEMLGMEGNWFRVEVDGREAYIYRDKCELQ